MDRWRAPETAKDLGFARLVSLGDARAALEPFCTEVVPLRLPVAEACGRVAAAPVAAPAPVPDRALALRDGWAVLARDTLGASSYSPCYAATLPPRVRPEDPLPPETDAVLPLPFVDTGAVPCEIYGAVAPGDGTRGCGGDLPEGALLAAAGEVLRPEHVALLQLAGVADIAVRVPSVSIISLAPPDGPSPAAAYAAAAAEREGATSRIESMAATEIAAVARTSAAREADLVLVLGDARCGGLVATAVSMAGKVLAHGIAVRPGDTMGCGVLARATGSAPVPVVFCSDRLENMLAAWLLLARPCLDQIARRRPRASVAGLGLARKIVSAPGMSDLVLLRRAAGVDSEEMWEPLATGDIPWAAILAADGWLCVAPDSEGFPAGQWVLVQGF
jgi:molybdopterin molybdotransferase